MNPSKKSHKLSTNPPESDSPAQSDQLSEGGKKSYGSIGYLATYADVPKND